MADDIMNHGKRNHPFMFLYNHPVVALYDDRTELFEYHPFSSRFFRTATTTKIRKADFAHKVKAVIPNTSLLVYCGSDRENLALFVYDLKKDREIARLTRFSSPAGIVCSENCVGLVNYPDCGDLSLYAWNGVELKLKRILNNVSSYHHLSNSGRLLYEQQGQPGRLHVLDCHFSTESRNQPRSAEKIGEDEPNIIPPELNSIEMQTGESLLMMSSNGQLAVTQRDHHKQRQFTIYNTETGQIVLRFHVSMEPVCSLNQCFSADGRFLVLKPYHKALVVDIRLKRKLWIPVVQWGYDSCTLRYINGDCYAQIVNQRNVEMYKIDETSNGWEPLE